MKIQKDNTNYLLSLFKPVNLFVEELYGNKTERKAMKALSDKIPLQKLEGVIGVVQITNNHKYFPYKITKPTELKRHISKLIPFVIAQGLGKKPTTPLLSRVEQQQKKNDIMIAKANKRRLNQLNKQQ